MRLQLKTLAGLTLILPMLSGCSSDSSSDATPPATNSMPTPVATSPHPRSEKPTAPDSLDNSPIAEEDDYVEVDPSFTPHIQIAEARFKPANEIAWRAWIATDEHGDSIHAYQVGVFEPRDKSIGRIFLLEWSYQGPDKGPRSNPLRSHLVQMSDSLYSVAEDGSYTFRDHGWRHFLLAKALGLSFATGTQYRFEALVAPTALIGPDGSRHHRQDIPLMKSDRKDAPLRIAFQTPEGPAYMTDPDLSPLSKSPFDSTVFDTHTVEGCMDSDCLGIHSFYLFRPDNTFLTYMPNRPIVDSSSLEPLPGGSYSILELALDYTASTLKNCAEHSAAEMLALKNELINEGDLIPAVRHRTTGDTLYSLKETHPLMQAAYTAYVRSRHIARELGFQAEVHEKSREAFFASIPLLLWKDPLRRIILFRVSGMDAPGYCEPIIYLYSAQPTRVHIQFLDTLLVHRSLPTYHRGWTVVSDTSGMLTNVADGKRFPYLFWEGRNGLFVGTDSGDVTAQKDMESLLWSRLTYLGLNAREIDDFVEAWLPKLKDFPYYRVAFYPTPVVDALAPFEVSPPPDQIIRVYVDFFPLRQAHPAPRQQLTRIHRKKGFILVEWGGLVRNHGLVPGSLTWGR